MAVLQEPNINVDKSSPPKSTHASFAKLLAGNDKKIRDKGLKKLKKWLSVRSLGDFEFSEDEFMKIWVGLFYSMWMSDLPLVQEELAESLSCLVHCFNENNNAALLFIKCFNATMATTWPTLDQYRVDKFSMLVRRFLRQSLTLLHNQGWPLPLVRGLMTIFSEQVLAEKTPLGLRLHFIEIFLEELAKVSKGELAESAIVAIMKPFVNASAITRDGRVRLQLRMFFENIIKQTDVALQYEEKFQAWKEAGCPGGNPDVMVPDSEDEEEMKEDENMEEEVIGVEEMEVDPSDGPLDPRAGSVHVSLPQLTLPNTKIIKAFKKAVKMPHATLKGKRLLLSLSKEFKKVDKGNYPFKLGKVKVEAKKKIKDLVESTAKNTLNFELKRQKKRKELKKKLKARRKSGSENDDSQIEKNVPKSSKKAKKEKSQSPMKQESLTAEESCLKVSPKKKTANVFEVTEEPEDTEKSPVGTRKRKHSDSEPELELPAGWIVESVGEPHKAKRFAPLELADWDIQNANGIAVEKKAKQSPKKNVEVEGVTEKQSPKKSPAKVDGGEEKENVVKSQSPKSKEAEKEVEIKISPKKKPVSPPAFFAKAFAKAGVSPVSPKAAEPQPAQIPDPAPAPSTPINKQISDILNTSKSGRRISWNLAKNMAQEKVEYFEQLERSPQIPFDAAKVPRTSALKAGLPPSPINPFYARKLKLTGRPSLS